MKLISKQNKLGFLKLSLKDYFLQFDNKISNEIELDNLTNFLTDSLYTETKPYLTIRQLKPRDNRFHQIEIIYDEFRNVKTIVWDLRLKLSELEDIFGLAIMHNEPYSNSTAFVFNSKNPAIEIIKTRHSKWLEKIKDSDSYEYVSDDKIRQKLSDPEFDFIQINLNYKYGG